MTLPEAAAVFSAWEHGSEIPKAKLEQAVLVLTDRGSR